MTGQRGSNVQSRPKPFLGAGHQSARRSQPCVFLLRVQGEAGPRKGEISKGEEKEIPFKPRAGLAYFT